MSPADLPPLASTQPFRGYAAEGEGLPPLGSYATLASGFVAAFGAFVWARRHGEGLPERMEPMDVILLGAAAQKLSRLIAKDKVAAFIRAPFTEHEGKGTAPGEVDERARGTGMQAAVGQLLTCPYCLGMWASAGLTAGLVATPRETRLAAGMLSALTVADFLQLAYRSAADA